MYLLFTSVASFYFCFAIETSLAAKNGYIVTEYPHIACKDPSSAIPECSSSLDYKIADISNNPDVSQSELEESRKTIINQIIQRSISANADDKCIKGIRRYICQTQYRFRCTEAYAEVNGKKIADTCEKARTNCTNLQADIRDSILNCSEFAINPLSPMSKIPLKLVCGDFPALKNDPYSCEAKYKVSIAIAMISISCSCPHRIKGKKRLSSNSRVNLKFKPEIIFNIILQYCDEAGTEIDRFQHLKLKLFGENKGCI